MKTRPVGQVFKTKGTKYIVVKDALKANCSDCAFKDINCSNSNYPTIGACRSHDREDGNSIHFETVEE